MGYEKHSICFYGKYGMKAEKVVKDSGFTGTLEDETVVVSLDCDKKILQYWIQHKKAYTIHLPKNSVDIYYPCVVFSPWDGEMQKCVFV